MNSAFLPPPAKPTARQAVFDLVRRNAGFKVKCNARGFIHPEFDGELARQAEDHPLAFLSRGIQVVTPCREILLVQSSSAG